MSAESLRGRVILAGGTGLIGRKLATALQEQGNEVILLSRTPGDGKLVWDGETVGEWASALEGAYAVINLAGETISQKFTDNNKRHILESRVKATQAIASAIANCEVKPYWINASAVGFYGDRADEVLTEASEVGTGFLAETCSAWEEVPRKHVGSAIVRIGVVLDPNGGALKPLMNLTKFFLAGPAGNGRQWMPWIHIDDLVATFMWLVQQRRPGTYNAVSPHPVTNREFMQTLSGLKFIPPVPAFVLVIIGKMIGPDSSLILNSCRVIPKALLDAGFEFQFSEIGVAFNDLLR